ncbi:MAG: enoyl-CoA hydratase/isomerase family protein [Rhodospirillales bacterium]|nr:enoyl-CoA hydratase/isomerase family protein [Rhodospirillales bacterium]
MAYEDIVTETQDGWLEISINRPEKRNAMRMKTAEELMDAMTIAEMDTAINGIILKSTDRGFCAGVDTSDFATSDDRIFDRYRSQRHTMKLNQLIRFLPDYTKPIISAIEGYALGGGFEMALMGDILIADTEAKLGLPEGKLGIIPGGGGTQTLPRLIGKNLAKEMMWTGRLISGTEAKEYRIVNHVTEAGGTLDKAREVAGEISKLAPLSVMYSKAAINRGVEMTLAQGQALERDLSFTLNFSEDRVEGLDAFKEKRAADFKGN